MLRKNLAIGLVLLVAIGFIVTAAYGLRPLDLGKEEELSDQELLEIEQSIKAEIRKEQEEKEAIIQERNKHRQLKTKKKEIIKNSLMEVSSGGKKEVRKVSERKIAIYGKLFLFAIVIIIGVIYLSKYSSEKRPRR